MTWWTLSSTSYMCCLVVGTKKAPCVHYVVHDRLNIMIKCVELSLHNDLDFYVTSIASSIIDLSFCSLDTWCILVTLVQCNGAMENAWGRGPLSARAWPSLIQSLFLEWCTSYIEIGSNLYYKGHTFHHQAIQYILKQKQMVLLVKVIHLRSFHI